ncbi:hypothetical protein TUM12370_33990 [Salmonella enterica subsp. enterica serovar Choleraesuis]|nr:hypothetical protein TUM12370_33990 [Salmonella enterica subsp. enterica serovar Choleraesuis]
MMRRNIINIAPWLFMAVLVSGLALYLLNKQDDFQLDCSAKGQISVNKMILHYVNSYHFSPDGNGVSSVSGWLKNEHGAVDNVGIQLYFSYTLDSGMLTLKNKYTNISTENTVSAEVLKKLFPAVYWKKDSEQKIYAYAMGGGYRFNYGPFPVNFCYLN